MSHLQQTFCSPNHSFNVDIACKYGIEEAIIIHHLQFWIRQNKALKRHQFEGKTWMFQTQREITAIYPYMSYDKVKKLLIRLVKRDVIIKGNFNKSKYDHTCWYAFKDERMFGISSLPEVDLPNENTTSEMHITEENPYHITEENPYHEPSFVPNGTNVGKNGHDQESQSAPSHITDTNTDANKTPPTPSRGACVFSSFGSHVKLKPSDHKMLIADHGMETIDEIIAEMNDYLAASKPQGYKDYAAAIRNWIRKRKSSVIPRKTTLKEKVAANFQSGDRINGYEINFDDYATSISPLNGQGVFTLKYSDKGFWEQFSNFCRKRNITLRSV